MMNGNKKRIKTNWTVLPKENAMPHVIVKLWPGKSEQQKTRLAEKITKHAMDVLN